MQLAKVVGLRVLAAGALAKLDRRREYTGDVLRCGVLLYLPVEAEGGVLHDAILEEFGGVAPPEADDDRDYDCVLRESACQRWRVCCAAVCCANKIKKSNRAY